jgi:hypothetical protein
MGFGTAMLPYGARRGGGRGLACGWTASGCSGHREGSGPGRVTPRGRGGEQAESDRERVSERVSDDTSRERFRSTRHGTVTAARRWPPGYFAIYGNYIAVPPTGPTRTHTVVKKLTVHFQLACRSREELCFLGLKSHSAMPPFITPEIHLNCLSWGGLETID